MGDDDFARDDGVPLSQGGGWTVGDAQLDEPEILERIGSLVEHGRALRANATGRTRQHELQAVEVSLDQYWDLLRQRRARQEFDQDPDVAQIRPAHVVEEYWS